MAESRILFDLSTYMLFEATGDSDAAYISEDYSSDAAEEDDAMSCSDGSYRREFVGGGGEEFDFFSGDEEDGVVDQCRRRAAAEKVESKGFEESEVVMSEREGDRLFWEACLAS